MSSLFVFDVDGVLCDKGEPIDEEFAGWFFGWMKDKEIIFVTGSQREKTIEQLGISIVNSAKIGFHCLGNSIFINGKDVYINQFTLNEEELKFLNEKVAESQYHTKTGNHIELRTGTVNFSIIGKNADKEQRLDYYNYDKVTNERIKIIQELTAAFPRLEAYIGGLVSIDICLRGANKGQIIGLLPFREKNYFFGDRCFEYGVDQPLTKLFRFGDGSYKAFQIDEGYKQTWEILKNL